MISKFIKVYLIQFIDLSEQQVRIREKIEKRITTVLEHSKYIMGRKSIFPAKPLGGYGDGEMCFIQNDAIADLIRSLRIHDEGGYKYDNARIGVNGRLDRLQASILLTKFEIIPEEIELR